MKEFVEKLIGRLEEKKDSVPVNRLLDDIIKDKPKELGQLMAYDNAISIVNQLAEEYKEKDCSKCSRRSWYQKGYADAERNNGWIPCSERLPDNREWVLAVFKEPDTDFVLIPRVADYVGRKTPCTTDEWWLIMDIDDMPENDYFRKLKCIAWQPLPAPFQKGE